MPATIGSGPGRTATPSSPRCCARSRRPRRFLPANAVGRDFRALPYIGLTDSRTGIEASLWGVIGIKVGWIEGVEMNFLGLVAGLDLRNPGVKLPGFGRIGLPQQTATAARRGSLSNPQQHQPADDHQRRDDARRAQRFLQNDHRDQRAEQHAGFRGAPRRWRSAPRSSPRSRYCRRRRRARRRRARPSRTAPFA